MSEIKLLGNIVFVKHELMHLSNLPNYNACEFSIILSILETHFVDLAVLEFGEKIVQYFLNENHNLLH